MKQGKLSGLLKACLCLILSLGFMVVLLVGFIMITVISNNSFLLIVAGKEQTGNALIKGLAMLLGGIIQNVPFILAPIILTLLVWKKKWSDLGYTSLKNDWKDFVMGILMGTFGITIALAFLLGSGSVEITGFTGQYSKAIFMFFLGYIWVGFGEETLCRGGLMLALRETKSKALIIVAPAVVFGALHLGNNGVSVLAVINLVGFGLFAGYCFYRSGNIWLPIGFHIAWNFVQGNVYGFHVSGTTNYSFVKLKVLKETIFTGGEFGPEGGLGVTIALIVVFVLVRVYYRNRSDSVFMEE